MQQLSYTHQSVRLTGRWDRGENAATTTAPGSYLEFAFSGRMAVAEFDVLTNAEPRLHLWIQIDGGDKIEAPVDSFLRVVAKEEGTHICRIIFKSGTEIDRRWYHPLTGKLTFLGVQVEEIGVLPEDRRPIIEFVGDSITEGVLIDADFNPGELPLQNQMDCTWRVWQDDSTATYAWLTAEAFDLRPIFMGYGAVGVTKSGNGNVPAAPVSYLCNFENSPITHERADYIMINHGANDRGAEVGQYLSCYEQLLDVIRAHNPHAVVIALSAFCGAHHEALGEMIAAYNQKHACHVRFIDSNGWVPLSPLHPLRQGHRTIAEHLIPLVGEIIKHN